MKKLKFISVFTLASMALFSCSSDDDSSSNISIEGLWNIHELHFNNVPQTLENCDEAQTVNFTDVSAISTTYEGVGCNTIDNVSTSTYSINGDLMTIIDDDGKSDTVNILELSANTLTLEASNTLLVVKTTYKR